MNEEQTSAAEFEATQCCMGSPETCGGKMEEMMKACPCGALLKRHRFAVITTLAGIGLGLLVLQAGWILGVIAFLRTV